MTMALGAPAWSSSVEASSPDSGASAMANGFLENAQVLSKPVLSKH